MEARALHIDAPLSNLSIQYRNDQMIWRNILPIVKVDKRSDLFFTYSKEDSYKVVDDKTGPKSDANEADWGVATDNYSVKDHALADYLPQEVIDNADNPVRPEVDTNDFLNRMLEIAQEKRVAARVFNATSYPAGNKVALAGDTQWGMANNDPISDVLAAVETCFVRANTLVFGQAAWQVFRALPEVLDAVKSTSRYQGSPGGLATVSEVAALFEVERLLVGRARYITSNPGQAAIYDRLWGKHAAAFYIEPEPSIKSITFGATFVETNRLTLRGFDEKKGIKGAHYIKVAWNSDEKIIASDLGYFIQNAVM